MSLVKHFNLGLVVHKFVPRDSLLPKAKHLVRSPQVQPIAIACFYASSLLHLLGQTVAGNTFYNARGLLIGKLASDRQKPFII